MTKLGPDIEKILIVEDNSLTLLLMESKLVALGFTVRKALDGKEALEILKQDRFDLLLIDLNIPSLSGKEVILKIMEEGIPRPRWIVGMSAGVPKSEIRILRKMGFDDFLNKPVDLFKKGNDIYIKGY